MNETRKPEPHEHSPHTGPMMAPRVPSIPEYVAHLGNGAKFRTHDFDDAATVYLNSNGYGLRNEARATDGGNFAGLTDEERGVIGL